MSFKVPFGAHIFCFYYFFLHTLNCISASFPPLFSKLHSCKYLTPTCGLKIGLDSETLMTKPPLIPHFHRYKQLTDFLPSTLFPWDLNPIVLSSFFLGYGGQSLSPICIAWSIAPAGSPPCPDHLPAWTLTVCLLPT